jgi:hypothetical protein
MTGFSPQVRAIMHERSCTVEGCDRPLRARGYCCTHWARWKRYGTHELPVRPQYQQCTVDGCGMKPRSKHSPYCEAHYGRLRRKGTTDDPMRVIGQCFVDDCDEPATASGRTLGRSDEFYCRMHYMRLAKRGDAAFDCKWDEHPRWSGDEATYEAMHQRVKKMRGVPSKHQCVDCGKQARHWSYDHTDPDQKVQVGKGPYSTDMDRYHPRCVRCHKKFDMARIGGRK